MIFPYGLTLTFLFNESRDRVGDRTSPVTNRVVPGCAIDWVRGGRQQQKPQAVDFRADASELIVDIYVPLEANISPYSWADVQFARVRLPDGRTGKVVSQPIGGEPHPLSGWQPGVMIVTVAFTK